MEFKDRNAQYPGRVKLVKVAGSEDLYDMTLAEGSVSGGYSAGTPLNAETFNKMLKDISAETDTKISKETEKVRLNSIRLYDGVNYGAKSYLSNGKDMTVNLPKSRYNFYFWQYSSKVSENSVVTLLKSQHGLSKVKGAVLVPKSHTTGGGLGGYNNFAEDNLKYGILISNNNVYVALDVGVMKKGFYCLVYGE